MESDPRGAALARDGVDAAARCRSGDAHAGAARAGRERRTAACPRGQSVDL